MADDQTLTPAEFAASIKANYPDYRSVPDGELVTRMLDKYPEYRSRVVVSGDSGISGNPDRPNGQTSSSPFMRAATQFYEKSPIGATVGLVKGAADAVGLTGNGFHPLDAAWDAVKGAAKAQWDQAVLAAQQAKAATHGGGALSASEAVGHGLAAILPLLGPVAADVGEHGARGDLAGMAGGAAGILAPFAVKYGLEAKQTGSLAPSPAAVNAATASAHAGEADLLRREAEQQVSQRVLAPGNPRYKGQAAAIAPQILDRGMQGDRLHLQQIADDGMDKAGAAIDAATQARTTPLSLTPILRSLDDRIADFQINGTTIPTAEGRIRALTQLRDYIAARATENGGVIPFGDLKSMRDEFYDAADKAKGYAMTGGNEHLADMGWAAREGGSAIRQAVATEMPALARSNADYTFFKRLSDVLDPNIGRPKQTDYVPTGVTGGMATAGAMIGGNLLGHIPGGAALGAWLVPKLKAMTNSPGWELASAQKKMALVRALEKGDVGGVKALITSFSEVAPRSVSAQAGIPAAASTPDNTRP